MALGTGATTSRVAGKLPKPCYGRQHRPRGDPTAASNRGGDDYCCLDLHAHGGPSLGRRSADKEGQQGGASTSNADGGSPAPEAGVLASMAITTTQQEELEGSPPRLMIAEKPAQSRNRPRRSTKKSTRARSRARRARLHRRPR